MQGLLFFLNFCFKIIFYPIVFFTTFFKVETRSTLHTCSSTGQHLLLASSKSWFSTILIDQCAVASHVHMQGLHHPSTLWNFAVKGSCLLASSANALNCYYWASFWYLKDILFILDIREMRFPSSKYQLCSYPPGNWRVHAHIHLSQTLCKVIKISSLEQLYWNISIFIPVWWEPTILVNLVLTVIVIRITWVWISRGTFCKKQTKNLN